MAVTIHPYLLLTTPQRNHRDLTRLCLLLCMIFFLASVQTPSPIFFLGEGAFVHRLVVLPTSVISCRFAR